MLILGHWRFICLDQRWKVRIEFHRHQHDFSMRVIQNIVWHIIAVGFWYLHLRINLTFAAILLLRSLLVKATCLSSIVLRVSFRLFYLTLFRSFIRINSLSLVGSKFIYRSVRLCFLSLMLMMVGFTHSGFKFLTGLRWVWVTLPIWRWLGLLRYVIFCQRIWWFWGYVEIQGFECTLVLWQDDVFWNRADILLLKWGSWRKLGAICNIWLLCRKILLIIALGVNFDLWIV